MFRSILKRSLSEGNILCENSPMEATDVGQKEDNYNPLPDMTQGGERGLSESTPEISTGERELSYPRCTCITIYSFVTRRSFFSIDTW